MITLHKKISYNFFFTKFWIGKFFRQFWENLEETRIGTWAEFRPQIGSKKTTAIISEGLHNSVLCSSHAQRLPYGRRAGRDLNGATPYVTQDLSFPSLTQRSATPCGLLQQSWCTEDFSWPRFLWEDLVRFIMLLVPLYGMGHVVIFVWDSMF